MSLERIEITLPSIEEVLGSKQEQELNFRKKYWKPENIPSIDIPIEERKQLEVFKKYGEEAVATDFAIVTGAAIDYSLNRDSFLDQHICFCWTRSCDKNIPLTWEVYNGPFQESIFKTYMCESDKEDRFYTLQDSYYGHAPGNYRSAVIRPVLKFSEDSAIFKKIISNKIEGVDEVDFGTYPQMTVDPKSDAFVGGEAKNAPERFWSPYSPNPKCFWAVDCTNPNKEYNRLSSDFHWLSSFIYYDQHNETQRDYQRSESKVSKNLKGRRFLIAYAHPIGDSCVLSNGKKYYYDQEVYIEVQPVRWLIDYKTNQLISKKGLVSGIRFLDILDTDERYLGGRIKETEQYLKRHMFWELFDDTFLKDLYNREYPWLHFNVDSLLRESQQINPIILTSNIKKETKKELISNKPSLEEKLIVPEPNLEFSSPESEEESNGITREDCIRMSEFLSTPTYMQMASAMSIKERIIILLKIGCSKEKDYSEKSIAQMLEIEEKEVRNVLKQFLLFYKESVNILSKDSEGLTLERVPKKEVEN